MKKIFSVVFAVLMAASVVSAVDLGGDCTAITSGWAEPATTGNYGGADLDSFCMVVDKTDCGNDVTAEIDLTFVQGANEVCIKHLDGIAGDDFNMNVKVGNSLIGTYSDAGSSEIWKTTCFDYSANSAGSQTVVITSTGATWASCSTYGQLAIDMVDAKPKSSDVPEFTTVGVVALLAGIGAMSMKRRRKLGGKQ